MLEIARLRFNVASDLEVLKDFHQLRVLKLGPFIRVTGLYYRGLRFRVTWFRV